MDKTSLFDLIYVTAFFIGGLALALPGPIVARLLAPRRTRSVENKTLDAIECGVETIGATWIRFGVVYYLYALIFIAFAVDVLFLFPVAVVYNETADWLDFVELVIFVGILALVIVYAWGKGVFTWKSRVIKSPRG
jgi:NADH-quinone oxidoreductase subunit A